MKTKFNIGDKVYLIRDDKLRQLEVFGVYTNKISITIRGGYDIVSTYRLYDCATEEYFIAVKESKLFKSKDDLWDYLRTTCELPIEGTRVE